MLSRHVWRGMESRQMEDNLCQATYNSHRREISEAELQVQRKPLEQRDLSQRKKKYKESKHGPKQKKETRELNAGSKYEDRVWSGETRQEARH